MGIDLSKPLNKSINSTVGIILIVIMPTIILYVDFFKENGIKIDVNKMELTVSLLVGVVLYLLLKVIDVKNKLIVLKEFRDYESLSTINFFNSEIKKLNDRLIFTEKKLKISINSSLNENEKRLFKEENKTKIEKILNYNEVFKKHCKNEYGVDLKRTFYNKLNYKQ